jgi:hypothetical protein
MDLFLYDPHILSILTMTDQARRQVPLEEPRRRHGRACLAPTGGGAMGDESDRKKFVEGSARPAASGEAAAERHPPLRRRPHRLGLRSRGLVQDPEGNREDRPDVPQACDVAETFGGLAAGRDLLGSMHPGDGWSSSWK